MTAASSSGTTGSNKEFSSGEVQWTTVIEPKAPLFDWRLRELWRYRDLVMLFVRRDFVAQYKQTVLGPLWHVIQPLLTSVVFTVVFGRIAQISTGGHPQFLFYLSGNVIWMYFAACLTKTSGTFITNRGIFGKVYFPRLAIPVSVLFSNLIAFTIQFLVFLGFVAFYAARGTEIDMTAWVWALPLLLALMAALGLGAGIIVSAVTTRYRDLVQLVGFGTTLLMYSTVVIYPLSSVPGPLKPIVWWNPMTPVIETFRYAFLGPGAPDPDAAGVDVINLLYSAGFAAALLTVGLLLFNRVDRTFMDTV